MNFGPTGILTKAALAGVIFLQASSVAPTGGRRIELPPESFVRAVATGNEILLDACFSERLDPNVPGADGRTPLLIAMSKHDSAMVQRLLDAGANVDLGDENGVTPLMVAAAQGDVDTLRTFVARSANVTATDSHGRSAAHHAIAARKYEAVDLLIPLMPALDDPAGAGAELIELACASADPKIMASVLRRVPPTLEWLAPTRAALAAALAEQNVAMVRLLLSKHPNEPTVAGSNVPLLAQAIVTDDTQLFETLLAAGANPNTLLPVPADKEFVSQIKSRYLRSFAVSDEGITLLMVAAGNGKEKYVRALLDAGADKNRATVKHKMLALYFAARAENWKCVQTLLGKGPKPEQLRVEISLASQRASVIKDGISIFNTAVSTGRAGFATPTGEYVVTDKKRSHRSTIYHVEMPFFMRLNCLDFGLHQGVVPNYPASHGCIRVPAAAAQKLFAEIPVGTLVTIN